MGNRVSLDQPLSRPQEITPIIRKETNILLIIGYCRSHCDMDESQSPKEIIDIIIKSTGTVNYHYLQVLCSEKMHRLGDIRPNEIKMNQFYQTRFNKKKCSNCGKCESLEFFHAYKQRFDGIESGHGFLNNANEYQCKSCQYFTAFNVRINIVQNNWNDTLQASLCYVNPFKHELDSQDSNEIIRDWGYDKYTIFDKEKYIQNCPCCLGEGTIKLIKQKTMYQDARNEGWDLERVGYHTILNVFYCDNCELNIHQIKIKREAMLDK